jgi:hypothetical protein
MGTLSIAWAMLRHAYGPPGDIPALLTSAETAPAPIRADQEPWCSLWSALCHQGDVYSASFAALPELIRIAASRDGSERAECLLLAGCIELERHEIRAPAMPSWLTQPYQDAIVFGAQVARQSLDSAKNADDRRRLEIAVASFTGERTAARHLLGEDEESNA